VSVRAVQARVAFRKVEEKGGEYEWGRFQPGGRAKLGREIWRQLLLLVGLADLVGVDAEVRPEGVGRLVAVLLALAEGADLVLLLVEMGAADRERLLDRDVVLLGALPDRLLHGVSEPALDEVGDLARGEADKQEREDRLGDRRASVGVRVVRRREEALCARRDEAEAKLVRVEEQMERRHRDGRQLGERREGVEPGSDRCDTGRDRSLNVMRDLEGVAADLKVVVDERGDCRQEGESAWTSWADARTPGRTSTERPADTPERDVAELGDHLRIVGCRGSVLRGRGSVLDKQARLRQQNALNRS